MEVVRFIRSFFINFFEKLILHILKSKKLTKVQQALAFIVGVTDFALIVILSLWGIVLMVEYRNFIGIIPVFFAAVLLTLTVFGREYIKRKK